MAIQSLTIFSNSSVRHAGVGGHDDLDHRLLAAGERGFHVALEQRGERLLVLPLRMLRRERLHAVEREEELEIHRLLAPERAVVVERRDALGRRHEIGRAFLRHLFDKGDDGFLRRGVVPRRERVLRVSDRDGTGDNNRQQGNDVANVFHGFGFGLVTEISVCFTIAVR